MQIERRVIGRPFQPGESGNPGGRPKTNPAVKEMFVAACPDAVQLLIDTMKNENEKTALRVACANTIIERVMGKAAQPIMTEIVQDIPQLSLSEKLKRLQELLHDGDD